MSALPNETVLGVITMARHGDRSGFYQDPTSYAAQDTQITPLGEVQMYNLGQYLRQLYLDSASPSAIPGLAGVAVADTKRISIQADAGGEGEVILDSAVAMTQGLYPATTQSSTTLANGTVVTSPLGGYQYIAVTSVEPEEDVRLEGWTECTAFTDRTKAIYASADWKAEATSRAAAIDELKPLAGNRSVTLDNAYNVYDYLNVQSIHDAAFLATTTPQQLAAARDLANFHEQALFSDSDPSGIGNIAGNAMFPTVLDTLQSYANTSSPIRFTHLQISYKPFITMFSRTGVPLSGLVDYASYMSMELRASTTGNEPVVRFNFRNGTTSDAQTYPMFGNEGDTPLSQVVSMLSTGNVRTLGEWCQVCEQDSARGCDVIAAANATSNAGRHLSLAAAGGIGAGVTIGVFALVLATLALLGLLSFGKKRQRVPRRHDSDSSESLRSSEKGAAGSRWIEEGI